MRSRILFISLLTLMIAISGFIVYRLFFYDENGTSPSKVAAPAKSNQPQQTKPGAPSGANAPHHLEESIWTDPRLKGTPENLKATAEVNNDVANLKKLLEQGSEEEFLKSLKALAAAHPDAPQYTALLGDYYMGAAQDALLLGTEEEAQKNFLGAKDAVEKLLEKQPQNLFAKSTLSEIEGNLKHYDRGLQLAEEVVKAEPGSMEALSQILIINTKSGKAQQGIDRLKELYEADPKEPNKATVYSAILEGQNKPEQAREVLANASPNANSMAALGNFALKTGKPDEAIQFYQQSIAVDNDPQHMKTTLQQLVQAAASQKNYTVANEGLNKLQELDPSDEIVPLIRQQLEEQKKKG